MAKNDLKKVIAAAPQNGTRVYVIRGRRNDQPHTANESPWFVAIFTPDSEAEIEYTTDVKQAQGFSSLISADLHAIELNNRSSTHFHAVDVYIPNNS